MNEPTRYKIMILGYRDVGKTAICKKIVPTILESCFPLKYYEEEHQTSFIVDDIDYELTILDPTFTESFTAMRDLYMKNSDGFILVYSIDSRYSFELIDDLIEQVLRVKDLDNFPMIIVGNKCDLEDERQVTTEELENITEGRQISFVEISAAEYVSASMVKELFSDLIRDIELYNYDMRINNINIKNNNECIIF
eukprot:TRINITY_DN2059_c0_g1_i1.p1 TRINITY_DN2059_c0_g1~~TRINITY_DN2059_c0_g1_i1.p1  ORF type:complete len:195 (-),score=36.80 TRINITY_DN2059_c0_g1_i1:49-633(-)